MHGSQQGHRILQNNYRLVSKFVLDLLDPCLIALVIFPYHSYLLIILPIIRPTILSQYCYNKVTHCVVSHCRPGCAKLLLISSEQLTVVHNYCDIHVFSVTLFSPLG